MVVVLAQPHALIDCNNPTLTHTITVLVLKLQHLYGAPRLKSVPRRADLKHALLRIQLVVSSHCECHKPELPNAIGCNEAKAGGLGRRVSELLVSKGHIARTDFLCNLRRFMAGSKAR